MGGWAETCCDCGTLEYEDDMTCVDGEYYCDGCAPEEDEEVGGIPNDDGKKKRECPRCNKNCLSSGFTERLTGWVCCECSHIEEVSMLKYCDLECPICRGNQYIATEVERKLTA